ncbi:MAG: hypothetical protein WJ306_12710 [Ferrovum myxofaciens]
MKYHAIDSNDHKRVSGNSIIKPYWRTNPRFMLARGCGPVCWSISLQATTPVYRTGMAITPAYSNDYLCYWRAVFMSEIHFIVEEALEGGYVARAVGVDIVTEADDLHSLHAQVRDAVHCHFDDGQSPSLIRLHITREEVLAA